MTAEPGNSRTVLVVEDDPDLRELLETNLRIAGYRTVAAADGHGALQQARAHRPDAVLLDLMLPGVPGSEVLSRLRADADLGAVPVVLLTARAEESDHLVGLALGADDYITKPFSMKVLLARLQTLLRRSSQPAQAPRRVRIGGVEVDLDTHQVTAATGPLKLTLTEFRILAALASAEGRVLSRRQLVSTAIGQGVMVTERTIDVHVVALRRKLGAQGTLIRTVRGVGYRMVEHAIGRSV
jgi:two-component system phosphate regulon response regulator PhoB